MSSMFPVSSIGDGGSGPCCAKNPTQKNVPKTPPRKMCQKPHPEKNRFDWKSQGQIFQECQGQIGKSKMCQKPHRKKPEKNRF